MRRTVTVTVTAYLILSSCHPARDPSSLPRPRAFVHWKDKAIAQLRIWGIPAGTPCETGTHLEDGVVVADAFRVDQCFRFSEPQRMHGLWLDQFEGSEFCRPPARPRQCFNDSWETSTWLEFSDPRLNNRQPTGGLYEIDFIGRHSLFPAMYGHMGMSANDVIVDRLVSKKEVEAPSKG
jgi:hypothetical protein